MLFVSAVNWTNYINDICILIEVNKLLINSNNNENINQGREGD